MSYQKNAAHALCRDMNSIFFDTTYILSGYIIVSESEDNLPSSADHLPCPSVLTDNYKSVVRGGVDAASVRRVCLVWT